MPLQITSFTSTGFYFSASLFLLSAILLLIMCRFRWKSDLVSFVVWQVTFVLSAIFTWFITQDLFFVLVVYAINLLIALILSSLTRTISLFGVFFLTSMILPSFYGLIWLYELTTTSSLFSNASWPLYLLFLLLGIVFILIIILNTAMLSWIVLVRFSEIYFKFPRLLNAWKNNITSEDSPWISIHVPCYNEPPEIVIETLNSLSNLNYPNFEVIVLDNNTKDPHIWKPIEKHCQRLGKRFIFHHIDHLPGAKAGALNVCLSLTSPQAEFISVMDADYVVKSNFLEKLIGFFRNPKIGFVQARQDYREWKNNPYLSACYYEYEIHFTLELCGQNEWDVTYTIGTMCLIRRKALQDAGGWAEWCLTEDSEVAVRIHALGYEGYYLKDTFGTGLIPETFENYKIQRFRWTAGPIQQFKKHWRLYLPWSSKGSLNLDLPTMNGSDSNSFPLEARKNEGAILENITPSFLEPEARASREKITSNMTVFIGDKAGLKLVQKFGEIFHSLSILFSEFLNFTLNIPLLITCIWFLITKQQTFILPTATLLLIPIAFLRNIICNWLSVHLLGGTFKDYIYSSLAARSLVFTRNMAFYKAWMSHLKWNRTDKFKTKTSFMRAFHSCQAEMIAGIIYLVIVVLIGSLIDFHHPDLIFLIWLGIVNQTFSFFCAPFMAFLSEKCLQSSEF